MPRTFRDAQAKWFPGGTLQELLDMDAPSFNSPEKFKQLSWAPEPGDCVACRVLTLRATSGTPSGHRRSVFSVRYLSDDARYAIRPWRTSPFEALAERLVDGAERVDDLFPRLI
jgi:hypothetical protein